MKKILFLLTIFIVSCGTFQFDSSNVFNINIVDEDTGKAYTMTCTDKTSYKTGEGIITDQKCVGALTIPDKGTYRCEIGFNTGGKLITENTTLKESCDIDIKK